MFGIEIFRSVFDDANGVAMEVGPDPDGLGCVRVYTRGPKNQEWFGNIDFSLNPDFALELAKAIEMTAIEVKSNMK